MCFWSFDGKFPWLSIHHQGIEVDKNKAKTILEVRPSLNKKGVTKPDW